MPVHKNASTQQRIDHLVNKIDECTRVVQGIDGSEAWKIIFKDFERQRQLIDDNWQCIFDEKKLDELRITKFAVKTLLDLINTYKTDLEQAKDELHKIQNPNTILNKYYDSESNYEQ